MYNALQVNKNGEKQVEWIDAEMRNSEIEEVEDDKPIYFGGIWMQISKLALLRHLGPHWWLIYPLPYYDDDEVQEPMRNNSDKWCLPKPTYT